MNKLFLFEDPEHFRYSSVGGMDAQDERELRTVEPCAEEAGLHYEAVLGNKLVWVEAIDSFIEEELQRERLKKVRRRRNPPDADDPEFLLYLGPEE